MKFLILLIGILVLILNYPPVHGSKTFPKNRFRSRRCVCLTITGPLCSCYPSQPSSQQIYHQEEVPPSISTVMPISSSQIIPSATSRCFPNCLQNCMQNQYSRCSQSCQNTCQAEQQQQLPQSVSSYTSVQYEPVPQQFQPSSIPVSEIATSSPVPVVQQAATSGTTVCIQECIPSCQPSCTQQKSTVSISPVLQPSSSVPMMPQPVPIVQQPVPSMQQPFPTVTQSSTAVPLQYEHVLQQRPQYETGQVSCVALCMPSCQSQCIQQTTALPVTTMYSTPAVVPTAIYPPATTQAPVPVVPVAPQQASCMYQCQRSCIQQCVQQGHPVVECRSGCVNTCENSCVSDNLQEPQSYSAAQNWAIPVQQKSQPVIQPDQPIQKSGYQYQNCLQQQSTAPALTICICPSGYQRCSSGASSSSAQGCCRKK